MKKQVLTLFGIVIFVGIIAFVYSAYIYTTDSFGVTYTGSDAGATWERGEAISLKIDGVNQIVVNFKETATPNRSRLWSGNRTLLYTWKINGTSKNATFTADTGSFPQGVYYIAFDKHGGSYNGVYENINPYPVVKTNVNYLNAFYTNGVIPSSNTSLETYFIMNITTRTGEDTPPAPNININLLSPANNSILSITGTNFTANFTILNSNANWTNATYYVWNAATSIFNKTKITLSGNLTNYTLFINDFGIGNYIWNVHGCYANVTFNNCTWGYLNNYSFVIGAELINIIYSNSTYETSAETFNFTVHALEGSEISLAQLVYNGINHTIFDVIYDGTNYVFSKKIDIPLNVNYFINQTNQFFLRFTYAGSFVQEFPLFYQNVSFINLQKCNATYSIKTLNFTSYDETNPNPKINITFHTFWNYWMGSGTIKKNYSFEDTAMTNSSFNFCLFPGQSTMKTNLVSEMTSTGFFPRTYYISNATISNATQAVRLYMINDTLGVKFFHTIRRGVARVSNAIVIISKFDVGIGTWVVVGIRKSDDEGGFIEYLELDKDYIYSITQNGIFLGNIEKISTCSSTPCLVNLDIEDGKADLWKGYYDAFAPNVVYTLTHNKTTHNVTYTFIDTSGLANYFRLQVNKISANDTGELICNKTLSATIGELECDLTGYTGQFVAKGYVARSPEKLVAVLYGVLSAIAEVIGKNEGLFITLLMVVTLGLIGAYNPAVGVILAGIAFIFAGIMGFIMISITAMILVFLLLIILVIKMGRQGV